VELVLTAERTRTVEAGASREAGSRRGIDIDEDMAFQRRTWIAERIGWSLFGLVLVAAALGLFGTGPLAETEATSPDGSVGLRYERFARTATETGMTAEIDAAPQVDGIFRLRLGPELSERYLLVRVQPEPRRMLLEGRAIVLELAAEPSGRPTSLRLWLKPDRPGLIQSEVGLVGGQPLAFWQLVYP
jgi:hypothetical protein